MSTQRQASRQPTASILLDNVVRELIRHASKALRCGWAIVTVDCVIRLRVEYLRRHSPPFDTETIFRSYHNVLLTMHRIFIYANLLHEY